MTQYKIVEAKDKDEAEIIMNDMAKHNWEVVSLTCVEKWTINLLITFVRYTAT